MPDRDRERSVDAVLRLVMSDAAPASAETACLDGEALAAWTSGALRPEEAAVVERHMADCGRCRTLAAAFIRSAPAEPAKESIWRRWRLGWVVPLATAATAAALWVALPENTSVYRPEENAAKSVSGDAAGGPVTSTPPVPRELAAPSAPPRQEATPPGEERAAPPAGTAVSKRVDEPAGREVADQRAPAAAPAPPAELGKREAASSVPQPFAARLAAAPPPGIISAPGGAARWRILGQQVEWSTTDGNAWEPVTLTSEDLLTAGMAPSSSVCWIVGRGGAVYLTTDGGRFMRLPFPEMVDLVSVSATDDRHAVVSAADGRSWQTSDQGLTWSAGR